MCACDKFAQVLQMRLALRIVIVAGISASSLAAEEEPPLHSVEFQVGPALDASGSIIASSLLGIKLLAQLINANVLYATRITPFLRYTGPIYQIPPLNLSSNQLGISYERRRGNFSYGAALRYTNVTAGLQVPETFIPGSLIGVNAAVLSRVTPEINSRVLLGDVFQAEGVFTYQFLPDAEWDPYLRATAGGGTGWLSHFGYGPYLHEVHGGFGGGVRWNYSTAYFASAELNAVGYWANTGSSSFIDRTDVLVNPGKGSIYIIRALLGVGIRF